MSGPMRDSFLVSASYAKMQKLKLAMDMITQGTSSVFLRDTYTSLQIQGTVQSSAGSTRYKLSISCNSAAQCSCSPVAEKLSRPHVRHGGVDDRKRRKPTYAAISCLT